ncbi:MAG: hypothetical protein LKE40_00180 [Spirochaetia bacterium]|jgi:hypothetical protein|nr:hypothetical protein [Spirochaetia bacterium]
MAEEDYPWYDYTVCGKTLEQGDIIENCKIIIPSDEAYESLLNDTVTDSISEFVEHHCIILSQSCDLQNEKIESVIVCPILSLKELITNGGNGDFYRSKSAREQLRQGNQPAYHLLNKVAIGSENEDYYCVSFRTIYSVPKSYLIALVGYKKRIRLLPPYREHLSQSFARYFMRVGLPSGIPSDEMKHYNYTT